MKKIIHLVFVTGLLCQQLSAQQQFIQTVSAQNTSCNTKCSIIDAPGFTYDPNALVFATSVAVNGVNSSSNLIGALYRTYERKWSIFNINGAPMALGTKFNLEYYLKPDANHFVLIVPRRVHANDPVYIDQAGLNNNPAAQVRIFPTNPTAGNSVFNISEVQVAYDPSSSKWIVSNKAGEDMESGAAFNVMFTSGSPTFTNPNTNKDVNGNILTPIPGNVSATNANTNKDINGNIQTPVTNSVQGGNCNCIIPKSLPPDSAAGGDLWGNYPSPMVKGLNGRGISNTAPKVGDVLIWNGTEWDPSSVKELKPYIISFKQSDILDMNIPGVDKALISGLDNKSFQVYQDGNIVFYTTVVANIPLTMDNVLGTALVNAWINVEIYNSSNKLVARATSMSLLGKAKQTIVAVGQGLLPAGMYHTSITISRGLNGSEIVVYGNSLYSIENADMTQGGEMIIEVFPVNNH